MFNANQGMMNNHMMTNNSVRNINDLGQNNNDSEFYNYQKGYNNFMQRDGGV